MKIDKKSKTLFLNIFCTPACAVWSSLLPYYSLTLPSLIQGDSRSSSHHQKQILSYIHEHCAKQVVAINAPRPVGGRRNKGHHAARLPASDSLLSKIWCINLTYCIWSLRPKSDAMWCCFTNPIPPRSASTSIEKGWYCTILPCNFCTLQCSRKGHYIRDTLTEIISCTPSMNWSNPCYYNFPPFGHLGCHHDHCCLYLAMFLWLGGPAQTLQLFQTPFIAIFFAIIVRLGD